MRKVGGQKDPVMALVRALRTEPGRVRHGKYLVDGAELVRRAFEFGASVDAVICTEAFAGSEEGASLATLAGGAETVMASEGLIGKCLGAKPTPSCVAIVERHTASLKDIFAAPCSLLQVVENGDNIDNLGMLLRSAEAAGVDGVILAGETVDPFNRRTVRGSRGAVFTLPICPNVDTAAFLKYAADSNIRVVATSATAGENYASVCYTEPVAIVVGNEHTGITAEMRDGADSLVKIPMLGKIHSLNIAVAASLMLYEVVRQRNPGTRN